MDMVSAFPGFILAMGIAAALGPSLRNLIIAIALVNVPMYARLMRKGSSWSADQYATAAAASARRRCGSCAGTCCPTLEPIFVQSTLQFGYAILDAAGLSFIGLGVRLPAPEWGVMVSLGIDRDRLGRVVGVVLPRARHRGRGDGLQPDRRRLCATCSTEGSAQVTMAAASTGVGLLGVEDCAAPSPRPPGPSTCSTASTSRSQDGEILGIVGESGSGKTMTALSITGSCRRHGPIPAARSLPGPGPARARQPGE